MRRRYSRVTTACNAPPWAWSRGAWCGARETLERFGTLTERGGKPIEGVRRRKGTTTWRSSTGDLDARAALAARLIESEGGAGRGHRHVRRGVRRAPRREPRGGGEARATPRRKKWTATKTRRGRRRRARPRKVWRASSGTAGCCCSRRTAGTAEAWGFDTRSGRGRGRGGHCVRRRGTWCWRENVSYTRTVRLVRSRRNVRSGGDVADRHRLDAAPPLGLDNRAYPSRTGTLLTLAMTSCASPGALPER